MKNSRPPFNYIVDVCYRWQHLVFVRVPKCASFFFHNNFNKAGWQRIDWDDIDWQNDHVFAHMSDPIERRHRAVLEHLRWCGLVNDFIRDPRLHNLLATAVRLDPHGFTYHDMFGELAWKIDWIPLTQTYRGNIRVTESLLSWHGCPIPNWDSHFDNISTGRSRRALEIIASTWEEKREKIWRDCYNGIKLPHWPEVVPWRRFHELPESLRYDFKTLHGDHPFLEFNQDATAILWKDIPHDPELVFKDDVRLWNAVTSRFRPDAQEWPQISWLRHGDD